LNPRELAWAVLTEVDRGPYPADELLDRRLRRSGLARGDRSLATELVYGTLRWRETIDAVLEQALGKPPQRLSPRLCNLLRLGAYQVLFLRIPHYAAVHETVELAKGMPGVSPLVNALLRRICREGWDLLPEGRDSLERLSIRWSHPRWMVETFSRLLGWEEVEDLLRANNLPPPLTIRTNTLRTTRPQLLQELQQLGLEAIPTPWSPEGIELRSASDPRELPPYREGKFWVQDEASQLVVHLLGVRPGERVLDLCAAPGGKTGHLAQLMGDRGRIVALDVSPRRVRLLRSGMRRLGVRAVEVHCLDASRPFDLGRFDRILADVPCSGLGVLRRHPELKWRRREEDLQQLISLQRSLLLQALQALTPCGTLLYVTCTLTEEENDQMVSFLLQRCPQLRLDDLAECFPQWQELFEGGVLRLYPHRHGTDGFFAARLTKVEEIY